MCFSSPVVRFATVDLTQECGRSLGGSQGLLVQMPRSPAQLLICRTSNRKGFANAADPHGKIREIWVWVNLGNVTQVEQSFDFFCEN